MKICVPLLRYLLMVPSGLLSSVACLFTRLARRAPGDRDKRGPVYRDSWSVGNLERAALVADQQAAVTRTAVRILLRDKSLRRQARRASFRSSSRARRASPPKEESWPRSSWARLKAEAGHHLIRTVRRGKAARRTGRLPDITRAGSARAGMIPPGDGPRRAEHCHFHRGRAATLRGERPPGKTTPCRVSDPPVCLSSIPDFGEGARRRRSECPLPFSGR